MKRHGINRISINPQTMEDSVLRAIGRKHTAAEIINAMEMVSKFDFSHVNMDLIAGLPEDSPEGFQRSLDACLDFGADNITVHTLSLKKGSRITLEGLRIPSAAAVGEMLDYADPTLRSAGYGPYYLYRQKYMSGSFENVGWTKSGYASLYNIAMMEELHTILALGGGGVTKLVWPESGKIERVSNPKYPQEYLRDVDKICREKDALASFLRQTKGV